MYKDNTNLDPSSGANKLAQQIVCFFSLTAELTDNSVTKDVFFDDTMFNAHCDNSAAMKMKEAVS